MMSPIWAIVPVGRLRGAKRRLATILTPDQRCALARAMLADVLDALRASRSLSGIMVVTADAEAASLAETAHARVLSEPVRPGLTRAVTAAAAALAAEGAGGVLVVVADVPLATADEIDALLARHGSAPAVTLVPAYADGGTCAIACSPPDVIAFQFGDDSFRRHAAAARARGIVPAVVELPGLGLDIDRPSDIAALLAQRATTQTQRLLIESRIEARLRGAPPDRDLRPGAATARARGSR
jgi:2-phospho-L-lactate guanylyltransferase